MMNKIDIALLYPDWCISNFGNIDFADLYEVRLKSEPLYSVDYLARRSLSFDPLFMRVLVRIRNILVRPFGLKTGFGKPSANVLYFEKGSVLVCFHVWERDTNIIVLQENDKHLNFRIIYRLIKDDITNEIVFQIATLVHLNNLVGRLYFTTIRPFHNFIMRYTINRLRIHEKSCDKIIEHT